MKDFLDFVHQTKTQAGLVILILVGGGCLLVWGGLSESAQGRILDMMYLGPSFYFIASKTGADKDKTIASLASTQVATVTNAENVEVKK